MRLAALPYQLGMAAALAAGAASIPLTYHLDTVLWFNEHYVTTDVAEPRRARPHRHNRRHSRGRRSPHPSRLRCSPVCPCIWKLGTPDIEGCCDVGCPDIVASLEIEVDLRYR